MNNKAFDTMINQKLHSYSAPVPAGLWEKIAAKDLSEPTDPFDEFVHQKLYQHSAEVPNRIWDNIHAAFSPQAPGIATEEEEKKRRKRFLFWFPQEYRVAASILLVLLVGTVAAYLFNYAFQSNKPSSPYAPVQVQEPSSTKNTQNTVGIEDKSATSSGKVTEGEPDAERAVTSASSAKKTENARNAAEWKLDRKNKTASFKERGSVFPYEQSLLDNAQKKNSIQLNVANTESDKSIAEQADEEKEEEYRTAEKAGNAFIRQNRNTWQGNRHNVNAYQHATSFKNVVICPTDRKQRNPDWDLEVYVSPDMAFKTISNNTATAQLLSRKDSSESMRPGFSAGFRIVKPLNDYLSLKTGLQYSQINERFTYKTENETRTTTVVTVRSIVRAPGDTLIVRDTSTLTQVGFKTNTVKNRFRSLDIPVLASVQFGNEDLKWGITAGAIVNVSSWYEGVLLDSSLAAVAVGKDNGMMYKKNIGLGLYAGFNITKRINYNTQLFFEPYLRYNLSNITTTGAPFNQKFSIGGLALGLRFNLNNR
ncbi:hypothetical protein TEGAF0_07860 [Sediminibacterium sp. TEGAF015]|nr:hypothetical protein TEGAF0_07860 [Sediminibacterium sp. TEGAF015]